MDYNKPVWERINSAFTETLNVNKDVIDSKRHFCTYNEIGKAIKLELKFEKLFLNFIYNEKNQFVKTEFSNGVFFTYEYDEKGNFIKLIDSKNRCDVINKYDENKNLVKTERYGGAYTLYFYDDNKNLIKTEESDGSYMLSIYDENNNEIKREHSNGLIFTYEYKLLENNETK